MVRDDLGFRIWGEYPPLHVAARQGIVAPVPTSSGPRDFLCRIHGLSRGGRASWVP